MADVEQPTHANQQVIELNNIDTEAMENMDMDMEMEMDNDESWLAIRKFRSWWSI